MTQNTAIYNQELSPEERLPGLYRKERNFFERLGKTTLEAEQLARDIVAENCRNIDAGYLPGDYNPALAEEIWIDKEEMEKVMRELAKQGKISDFVPSRQVY